MQFLETEEDFSSEVARIKRAAIEHRRRVNRTVVALLFAGVGVGVAVWFSQDAKDRDEIHGMAAIGLGLATFFFAGLLCRLVFPQPSTECPKCGCDWNAESENDVQKWLAWQCCPRCGLKMSSNASSKDSH